MKQIILRFLFLTAMLFSYTHSDAQYLEWAKAFGNDDFARSVSVDHEGNVYTAIRFAGTSDFDPGPSVFNLSTPNNSAHNLAICKLDSAGNFIWAKMCSSS